ncbi:MAG: tetratricopeptide repeat protein [Coriobacteriia bacterium]|nr:tetratricopeptide repeat protein [Coriobacteriia bacterium]
MNTDKFSEAQEQYQAGDYRKSARLFLDAVEKGTPIGNGPAYHMAGNSFMRLKRYSDAAVVFEHALRDDTYQRRGAVEANLANAYIQTGDYDSAVAHYEAALTLEDAANAHKFYQGIAQAYMQQEKFELAAIAYKHAALDKSNPTPGKSLLNLGLAMMASGNPKGAIEAYQAALTSPDYRNKGRALANKGIAQHALGLWSDAVSSLAEAKAQPGYIESELAQQTLADAQHRIAIEQQVALADQAIEGTHAPDPLDMNQAAAAQAAMAQSAGQTPPMQLPADAAAYGEGQAAAYGWTAAPGADLYPQREVKVGNAQDVERFFSRSEKEVARQGREKQKQKRGRFFVFKIVSIVVLIVGLLAGGVAALYFTGQGYPSAETTVSSLLRGYAAGRSISEYWTFDMQANIESKMVVVPIPVDYTIEAVNLGAQQSTVSASIHTAGEETLIFTFGLVREGIGWKVNEIVMEGLDGPSSLADPHGDFLLNEDGSLLPEDFGAE